MADSIMDPMMSNEADVLSSLAYYEELRASAIDVRRDEGNNLDIVTLANGDEVPMAHFSLLVIFWFRNNFHRMSFDVLFAVTKAMQDLNAGNGAHVPALQGLPERCPIRFTMESEPTEAKAGISVGEMIKQTTRVPGVERIPTGFLGAFASSVTGPTSLVSGLLGYPQISGSSSSTDFDDKGDHPLFARTVPADEGNTIPLILYFKQVLKLENLVILNDNSSYGNSYADAMRRAALQYAPEMKLVHIPIDNSLDADEDNSAVIQAALQLVVDSEIRYIFTGARTSLTPQLLTEAYAAGLIGEDSEYAWFGANGFAHPQESDRYEADDPLYSAFQGTGNIEFAAGIPGEPTFMAFQESLGTLKNAVDIKWMEDNVYPTLDEMPNWLDDPTFLAPGSITGFATFFYEATVALGLAACNAMTSDMVLTGDAHYQALKDLEFDSVSGIVRFLPETGSRDPTGLLYRANNFIQEDKEDGGLGFKEVITHLFSDGKWSEENEYVFADGSTNPPAQLTPQEEASDDEWLIPVIVSVAALLVILAAVIAYFIHDRKRRAHDSIQRVKRAEIIYDTPPEVLGRGVFGLVLLGEYRGTKVATKQIVSNSGSVSVSPSGTSSGISSSSGHASSSTGNKSLHEDISGYYPSVSGQASGTLSTSSRQWKAGRHSGIIREQGHESKAAVFTARSTKKALSDDLLEEMKVLSKLRHPCVTTFMGICIDKESSPMLVMEYLHYGALYDVLHNKTVVVDGEIILRVLRDISQGVRFLHSADPTFIHGDLKSANILLDSKFRAKVADFGLSDKKGVATGTPYWQAPELLRKESVNTTASDVFSLGVILYELYSRKEPYEGEVTSEVLKLVADEKVQKRPGVPQNMPPALQSIMADCLTEEPERRPPAEEIDTRLHRLTVREATPTDLKNVSRTTSYESFPAHIAEALQEGHQVDSEHKECLTIYMADIVGFEQMSAHWSEEKVADLLKRFHGKLDSLCAKHEVFKIKTIGVSYMAVANLFDDQMNDHAKRIADFAKESLVVASQTLLDDKDPLVGTIALRIGVHSGPAIAGVVGTRSPRFSLFGDAVNTSMCMESTSEVGRISLSKMTAELLMQQEPALEIEDRGLVRINRKGKMHCCWLGATNAASDAYQRIMAKKQNRLIQKGSLLGSDNAADLPEQAPAATQPSVEIVDEEAPSILEQSQTTPVPEEVHQETFDSEFDGDNTNDSPV